MVIFWDGLNFSVLKIIFIFESSMFDIISIREIELLNNTAIHFPLPLNTPLRCQMMANQM